MLSWVTWMVSGSIPGGNLCPCLFPSAFTLLNVSLHGIARQEELLAVPVAAEDYQHQQQYPSTSHAGLASTSSLINLSSSFSSSVEETWNVEPTRRDSASEPKDLTPVFTSRSNSWSNLTEDSLFSPNIVQSGSCNVTNTQGNWLSKSLGSASWGGVLSQARNAGGLGSGLLGSTGNWGNKKLNKSFSVAQSRPSETISVYANTISFSKGRVRVCNDVANRGRSLTQSPSVFGGNRAGDNSANKSFSSVITVEGGDDENKGGGEDEDNDEFDDFDWSKIT